MNDTLSGPDLTKGVALSSVADGAMLLGHAHGEPVLLARHGDALFAIGAVCTHYGAPLADGLLVDETVRCPWHHACFSLRTGEALRPPALDPVSCWQVEQRDGAAGSQTVPAVDQFAGAAGVGVEVGQHAAGGHAAGREGGGGGQDEGREAETPNSAHGYTFRVDAERGRECTAPRFPPPAVRRDRDWPVSALVRRARFVLCGRAVFPPAAADTWLPPRPLVRAAVGMNLCVI